MISSILLSLALVATSATSTIINGTLPNVTFNWGLDSILVGKNTLIPICQPQNITIYSANEDPIVNLTYPLILTIAPVNQVPFTYLAFSVDNSSEYGGFFWTPAMPFGQEFILSLRDSKNNYGGLAARYFMANGTTGYQNCGAAPKLARLSFTTEAVDGANSSEIDIIVSGGVAPFLVSTYSPDVIGGVVNASFSSADVIINGITSKLRMVSQLIEDGEYWMVVSDANGLSSVMSSSYTGNKPTMQILIETPSTLSKTPIIIGVSVGGVIALMIIGFLSYLLRKKSVKSNSNSIDATNSNSIIINVEDAKQEEDKSSYRLEPLPVPAVIRPSLVISTDPNSNNSTDFNSPTLETPIVIDSPTSATQYQSLTPLNASYVSRIPSDFDNQSITQSEAGEASTSPLANPAEFVYRR